MHSLGIHMSSHYYIHGHTLCLIMCGHFGSCSVVFWTTMSTYFGTIKDTYIGTTITSEPNHNSVVVPTVHDLEAAVHVKASCTSIPIFPFPITYTVHVSGMQPLFGWTIYVHIRTFTSVFMYLNDEWWCNLVLIGQRLRCHWNYFEYTPVRSAWLTIMVHAMCNFKHKHMLCMYMHASHNCTLDDTKYTHNSCIMP